MSEQAVITPEVMPDEAKELAVVVQQNAIEPATAQSLQQSFAPLFKEARDLITQSRNIVVTDATQTVQIKLSREYRLALRKIRIKGENTRKELKEASLRTGKAIDAFNTILLHTLSDEETRLEEQEKIVERAEAARKTALKQTREEALKPYGTDTTFMSLADMPDATFAQLLENAHAGHEAKLAATAKAEQERIEAENARLKEQARIREENERLQREAKEREEQRRVEMEIAAKEKARVEEEARKEREAAAKEAARIQAEADAKLAEERKKAEDAAEAARKEREAIELQAAKERKAAAAKAQMAKDLADALAKKEREAREQVERELKAHREAEEARKREADAKEAARIAAEQEAARRAAAAPDKDRLITFANQVRALEIPAFQSEAAKALSTVIASQIAKLATWLEEKSNAL